MKTQTKVMSGLALLVIAASTAAWALGDRPDRQVEPHESAAPQGSAGIVGRRIAAPGRIEGATDTIDLGTTLDGRLAEVRVREGERVEAGQALALLECSELGAQAAAQRARRDGARAALARLRRGGRPDARRAAEAQVEAATAALTKAAADERRANALWHDRLISRDEYERAATAARLAEAQRREAGERMSVAAADPLPEDLAAGEALVAEALADMAALEARLAHCVVSAPMSGVVLRVYRHAGESVSTLRAEPIVSVSDTSRLRVRAEVDEADALRVHVGEDAVVTADAFEPRALRGRVTAILGRMGRRTVVSGDPADKSDRDVLEVLVALEPTDVAPVVGLRVRVLFGEPSDGDRRVSR